VEAKTAINIILTAKDVTNLKALSLQSQTSLFCNLQK
jgi:hypothetical protein